MEFTLSASSFGLHNISQSTTNSKLKMFWLQYEYEDFGDFIPQRYFKFLAEEIII